jgi:hypothetical protein
LTGSSLFSRAAITDSAIRSPTLHREFILDDRARTDETDGGDDLRRDPVIHIVVA